MENNKNERISTFDNLSVILADKNTSDDPDMNKTEIEGDFQRWWFMLW